MTAATSDKKTNTEISEIFSSVQGEGFYLGARQIFVRFGRCNMHCVYCDELEKMQSGAFSKMSSDFIVSQIKQLDQECGPHHSVSFTGGEPLMYPDAFAGLLKRVKQLGFKTYLETNATYPETLQKVLSDLDILSIDLKPESSSGDRSFWNQHRDFLKIASAKEGYVKVVVTAGTTDEDIRKCLELVAQEAPQYRVVLQPVSGASGPDQAVLQRLENNRRTLCRAGGQTPYWVIPQMHKIWKVR
ncbi:MAG: 7-carboxy-7-deazaguanine synthase QueE [Candidatus Omnitrophica bacterium]|nr:7-carboxy-7-deazaguanine synthase QueE [Candidatus Omnitrophota bacterium]